MEDYLQIEPSNLQIQADIAKIQDKARLHKLDSLKKQATDAATRENWDTAIQAWDSYLVLEPEDYAQTKANLQHAQKYTRIASDYAEVQVAIWKKRFGKAIELHQSIIAQDPSYQATSQLLVETVEAQKAIPVWRRPWSYAVSGAITWEILTKGGL